MIGVEPDLTVLIDIGPAEGLARAVALQLRLKFGELPASAHAWLQSASDEQLERCLEKILSAQTLDELLRT